MKISSISNYNINKSPLKRLREVVHQPSNANFTGKLPESRFFKPVTDLFAKCSDKITDIIANVSASVLKNDFVATVVSKTEKKKIEVVKHIMAGIGVMISSLYIFKTLKNKNLDADKKTTLAVNQGIVAVVATTLGYVATGAMNKPIDKVVRKFSAANAHHEELPVLRKGLAGATSMIVFGLMYRYIAPVLVTPVANSIGNRIQANKKAAALNKAV